jgi:hypothetical protein
MFQLQLAATQFILIATAFLDGNTLHRSRVHGPRDEYKLSVVGERQQRQLRRPACTEYSLEGCFHRKFTLFLESFDRHDAKAVITRSFWWYDCVWCRRSCFMSSSIDRH